MLTAHKNVNPTNEADARRTLRTLGKMADTQSKAGTGLLNARWFGAVGDGIVDDTRAIQNAIDAQVAGGEGSGVFLPPGRFLVTRPIVVTGTRGFRMVGAGASIEDAGEKLGSCLIGSGLAGSPVLDLNGPASFEVRDLTIRGNPTDTLTAAAGFGLRVRSYAGYGAGFGLIENVDVYWCDQGINCGNGGIVSNAADMTLLRVGVRHCNVGFRSDHAQALNYGMHGCDFQVVTDAIQLVGGNLYAAMLTSYDIQRLVYVEAAGGNLGHVTVCNARLDGTTYRPILYETGSGASVSWATLMDVHCVTGQPSTGAARIKLTHDNLCKVIGGANLCGAEGPLFDLNGTGGVCSILVEGVELPDDTAVPGQVVGTITGTAKFRVRNCFKQSFGGRVFLTDFEN